MTEKRKEEGIATGMRFVVAKKKPSKTRPTLSFKIKLRSYKKEHIEEALKKNPDRKSKTVEIVLPATEWERYGFHEKMTFEEAKERVRQLNAEKKIEDERAARLVRIKRLQQESLVKEAFLPKSYVEEFEKRLEREYNKKKRKEEFSKWSKVYHWRKCKEIVAELSIPINEWSMEKDQFYAYFIKNEWSYSYVQKIISMLNKWSEFIAYKLKQYHH